MEPRNQFIDGSSITTFGGATIVVVAISLALRRAFGINSPRIPFFVSAAVVLASSFQVIGLEPLNWLSAFANVCLLYAAAIGAHETAADAAAPKSGGGGEPQARSTYAWTESFLK